MRTVRVHNFTISLDGFAAGPHQSLDDPLGVGGMRLHEWLFATGTLDTTDGASSLDDEFVRLREIGVGATIIGRNMFGPIRGEWGAQQWTGWWGDDPPFHHPVFVLTHHPHGPIEMDGGTTFHFVTDGIHAALEQARAAAGEADVCIGGGAQTVQQYLRARLIDELHLVIAPVLLGAGERLFTAELAGPLGDYEVTEMVSSPAVTHVRLRRTR